MTSRRKNKARLKSMEEFKCKNSGLNFVLTILTLILVSLLFFYRREFFKEQPFERNLTIQIDTQQQTETKITSTSEANSIVDVEVQVEAEKPVENLETNQDIESALETNPLEKQVYEDFIIPVTEKDIGLVVMAVQHEVGSSRSFYPDANLDIIQRCMARVIINQVIEGRWGNSVSEILFYPGHFMSIERLQKYDPYEETTRKNVLTVLRGEDSLSSTITIEMSFSSNCTFDESIEIMESQVGPVIPYFWTVTSENRLLIFAEPNKTA